MNTDHLETTTSPGLVARMAGHTTSASHSFRLDGPQQPASLSADQSEAAALLDLGQPLLVHATFNHSGVTDTCLRFDLVLPALLEEVIEQVRGILHAVDDITDPYRALKV